MRTPKRGRSVGSPPRIIPIRMETWNFDDLPGQRGRYVASLCDHFLDHQLLTHGEFQGSIRVQSEVRRALRSPGEDEELRTGQHLTLPIARFLWGVRRVAHTLAGVGSLVRVEHGMLPPPLLQR